MKRLLVCSFVSFISIFTIQSVHVVTASPLHSAGPQGEELEEALVQIDTQKSEMALYVNHALFKKYHVALGKPQTPTPIGRWLVIDKQKDWGSGFGTRWIELNVPWGTYGIHGTNRPYSIGHPASAGCIRMHNRDVEEVYEKVHIGTPVIVIGDPVKTLRNMGKGDVGADVRLIQDRLRRLGYYTGPLHGRFDQSTESAVKAFEKSLGLPITGIVGKREYHELGLVE